MIPAPLPECRFRGREVAHERWFCASPKLVIPGRVVAESYCRQQCQVADQGAGEYPDSVSFPLPLPPQSPRVVQPRLEQIGIGIVTAPRELPTLPTTLLELRRAGFLGVLHVFAEPGSSVAPHPGMVAHEHPTRLGLWGNWLHAARSMLQLSEAPFVLLCEDDLWLTRDAALALSHAIDTLSHDTWGYASLYTPAHNLGRAVPVIGWQAWDHPEADWGALAYCFSRHVLQRIVDEATPNVHDHTDQKVSSLLSQWGLRRYFHVPSLCAHAGGMNSATGHRWHPDHRAVGFEHERVMYRAPPQAVTAEERLRVGLVTPILALGGAENWIRNIVQHLDEQRIAVTGVALFSSERPAPEIIASILKKTTIFVPRERPQESVLRLPGVRETASAWECLQRVADLSDVLILWGMPDLNQWFSALNYSGRVVVVSHGNCQWTQRMMAHSSGRGHERVGVSQLAATRFPPGPRAVILNGAEESRCVQTISRTEMRRQWGVSDTDVVVGYLGRLGVEKNPLAAATAVRALGPPYRSVYVGNGLALEAVQHAAAQLDPRTLFVGARDDVGNVLRAFDVFILASPSEGFSLAITEAWLCGVPVVSTPVGCVPELEARFGPMVVRLPVDPRPEDLAAAVQQALSPAQAAVVRNAQRVAKKHLTAREFGQRWTAYLLNGKPA